MNAKKTTQQSCAIVTGAAGGIGYAVTRQLCAQGFGVFMLDVRAGPLSAARRQLAAEGARAQHYALDATVATQVTAAVKLARSFGRIDALVNIIGGSGPKPLGDIERIDEKTWDLVMDLNLKSTFLMCRAVMPEMRARRYGRIVNMSSIAAHGRKGPITTQGARLAYATAKAGIIGFTSQLAKDVARYGITVNCVLPGLILGEKGSRIRDRFDTLSPAARKAMLNDLPTGRVGETHEVAAAIGFLVSQSAAYVSGAALPIDGAFH